jgi:hypothetical protein
LGKSGTSISFDDPIKNQYEIVKLQNIGRTKSLENHYT